MDVLERPRPEEERIVIVIWHDHECDPRERQLRRFEEWLQQRTRWQIFCLHTGTVVVFDTLLLWLNSLLG